MGPLDIFLGWQPLLIAGIAYMVTQLIKATVDTSMGAEKRKASKLVSRVVLPAVPPILGACAAMVIPAYPESIVTYIAENSIDAASALLIYGAWGAACGQFADYLYSKTKDLLSQPS